MFDFKIEAYQFFSLTDCCAGYFAICVLMIGQVARWAAEIDNIRTAIVACRTLVVCISVLRDCVILR